MRGTIPGNEVRELREALRLSVTQFAAVMGVHPNSVHRWERLPDAPIEGVPFALLSSLRQYTARLNPRLTPELIGKDVQQKLAVGGVVLALAFLFALLVEAE